jgi:heme/copper-type cytochrome/quinol oxidase subunit 2
VSDQSEAINPGRRSVLRWHTFSWVLISVLAALVGVTAGLIVSYNRMPTVTDDDAEGFALILFLVLFVIAAVLLIGLVWVSVRAILRRRSAPGPVHRRPWIWPLATLAIGIATSMWWWATYMGSS